jgi:hypothetical protein
MRAELDAYRKFSKLFRRFSINKTEMIPKEFIIEGIIYNGMGDFTTFKHEGNTLDEAVEKVLVDYSDYMDIPKEELDKFLSNINTDDLE